MNGPGAAVPKGTGEYGQETVMMENADSESAANSTASDYTLNGNLSDYRKANDDDLVKVVLRWPKDLKLAGAKLELKHIGLEVDPTKTTDAQKFTETGASRLKFYKPDGTRLTDADLVLDNLGSPGSSYLAQILNTGELTTFIEGSENFGYEGSVANNWQNLGGAMLKYELTYNGRTTRQRLLVYRGGFLVFRQPTDQPGQAGPCQLRDGKGRVKHRMGNPSYQHEFEEDETDLGNIVKSWTAKTGKLPPVGNPDYRIEGRAGYTPPGWWQATESRLDETEQQTHPAGRDQVGPYITNRGRPNERWRQAAFCRWLQDDAPARQGYSAAWVYDHALARDVQIGPPTFKEYKFRLSRITPTTPYNRNSLLIHPDGKRDGTLGCIGLQTWQAVNEAYNVLHSYHGLKVKVQDR